MNWLDYLIIALYILAMLLIGYFMRDKGDGKSYFIGNKNFGWFSLLLSTMATQLSAISFISAPAFVGMREGGGMKWLSFEFGVPLAMIFLSVVITPFLYRAGIVSAYEFLEQRFGRSTRLLISTAFLLSRSFSTGVAVYTVALLLESVFYIQFWQTIGIICVVTMLYSLKGGLNVVVFTDVIQMFIKYFGILVCLGFALYHIGGWEAFIQQVDHRRTQVIDLGSWGFNGDSYGFFPMIFGGFVLYASYYGCDQTQVQRALAASSLAEVRKMYMLNGIVRFFVTLTYCITGLVIGTLALSAPTFMSAIPSGQPDKMLPVFILQYLPNGIIGLVIVAIFAAAMSSLSTNVNALAAVTMEDFVIRNRKLSDRQYSWLSQVCVLVWGAICVLTAAVAGGIADTVIEAINKIGSIFYGPILATFSVAILSRRVKAPAMNTGLITGVLFNVYLWKFQPQIFWFWWNFLGCVVTLSIALGLTWLQPAAQGTAQTEKFAFELRNRSTLYLMVFFALILLISMGIPYVL
ncbi:MAG: sodium transporter [Bacteroidetes bacterium]|nr:MAG: sodium transporter [Bacteroidota bacterium]